jgi:lipoprotein-anchoring transpeptidase ErfK/SrfK
MKVFSRLAVVALVTMSVLYVGVTGAMGATKPATPALSTLKVQQLLAELGYLPLRFVARGGTVGNAVAQPGTFGWRWALPGELRSQWRTGVDNVIEEGGLMTFQRLEGLSVTGAVSAATEQRLVADAEAGRRDLASYNYVYVSKTEPETAYLYIDGKVVFTTLVNTGVNSAPTESGTWPVYLRYRVTTMSGTYPDGSTYSDPGIPWVSYFHGGDALHGFIRASYGWPQSLGCVEMPFVHAQALWPHTPVGTLVSVATARP